MKKRCFNILCFSIVLFLHSSAVTSEAQRGYTRPPEQISVLTISLLFSEVMDRDLRLSRIADFVLEQERLGKPVDVILLQEVIGGVFVKTVSSSIDLKYDPKGLAEILISNLNSTSYKGFTFFLISIPGKSGVVYVKERNNTMIENIYSFTS